MMDDNRGKVLFVLVDSVGTYGPLYRQLFPDLRNATFFVSQPGETFLSFELYLRSRSMCKGFGLTPALSRRLWLSQG